MRGSRALARVLVVLLAVGGALVVGTAAQAHDVLRSTDPADGSTVPVAPEEITLTFDQPALALGTQVVVQTPDGRDAATGDPVLVDTTVTQAVGGALPAGEYTVQWRVTSSDGHPIDGTFTFTAAEASGDPEPAPTPSATPASEAPSSAAPTASADAAPTPAASARPVIDPGPAGGGPAAWVIGALVTVLVVGAVAVVVSVARDRRRR